MQEELIIKKRIIKVLIICILLLITVFEIINIYNTLPLVKIHIMNDRFDDECYEMSFTGILKKGKCYRIGALVDKECFMYIDDYKKTRLSVYEMIDIYKLIETLEEKHKNDDVILPLGVDVICSCIKKKEYLSIKDPNSIDYKDQINIELLNLIERFDEILNEKGVDVPIGVLDFPY